MLEFVENIYNAPAFASFTSAALAMFFLQKSVTKDKDTEEDSHFKLVTQSERRLLKDAFGSRLGSRAIHLAQRSNDAINAGNKLRSREIELINFEAWQECPKCGDIQLHWIKQFFGLERKPFIKRQCRTCNHVWEQF